MADQMILDAQRDSDGSVERLLALCTDLRAQSSKSSARGARSSQRRKQRLPQPMVAAT
jgi:hypothetical protein